MKRFLAPAIVLSALAGAAGCTANRATSEAPPAPEGELVVRRGALPGRVLITGELKAIRSEPVTVPQTETWQLQVRWLVEDGAQVRQGDRVAELDHSQFTGDLEQKRFEKSAAANELRQLEADVSVKLAEKQFELDRRAIELEKARIEAAVPAELRERREHQELQLALERAEVAHEKAQDELEAYRESSTAELEVLRIKVREAQRKIRVAERAIEALVLRAPVDGLAIVAENWREGRKFQVGDSAHVGLALVRMPVLSAMKVEAWLSDVDDGLVVPGMPATCTLDTYPDLAFPGRVEDVTPIAQSVRWQSLRRAFRVSIRLDEADPERMRPGMSVKVEVRHGSPREALLAPRAALDLAAEPPRAFLADGDVVEVALGACDSMACEVESGLAEGARLRRAG